MILRHKLKLKVSVAEKQIPADLPLCYGKKAILIILESFILLIHTPPYLEYPFIWHQNGVPIHYTLDAFLSALQMLKFRFLFRVIPQCSVHTSIQVKKINRMYG